MLGVVTKPHGIRGSVRVKVFNDETDLLVPGQLIRVSPPNGAAGAFSECTIATVHPSSDVWVLKLDGVDTIDDAETLRGAELWVDRSELPEPAEDEFYFVEAPLMTVVDQEGNHVAKVLRAESYPSTDVVVCDLDGVEVEWSIAAGVFVHFDRKRKTLTIDSDFLKDFRAQLREAAKPSPAKLRLVSSEDETPSVDDKKDA